MARIAANEAVVVKPQSNVYTALSAAGLLAVALTLIYLFVQAQTMFPGGLFGGGAS